MKTPQPQSNAIPTANIPLLPAVTLTRPAAPVEDTRSRFYNTDGLPEVDDLEDGPVYNDDEMWFLPPPSKVIAAPVIEEPAAPKMGDTITFTTKRGDIKQGEITAISIKSVEKRTEYLVFLNGFTYAVRPEQILPAKMPAEAPVMDADTAPVIETKDDLYNEVKQAEEIYIQYMRMDTFDLPADHATYKRKVAAHIAYLRAQAAYTGLSNDHLIAYLYGKGAVTKTAPQQAQTPVSSPAVDIQVSTIETAQEWPNTPPMMGAEGRREGYVKFYNKKEGYGYIVSDNQEFYFQNTGLHRIASAIHLNRGTTVSFDVLTALGDAGQPKAVGVMIGSYIPAPRERHQINPAFKLEAQESEAKRLENLKAERARTRERNQRNAASLANMPKRAN